MEEDGIFFQLLIRKIQGGTRRDKEGQGGTKRNKKEQGGTRRDKEGQGGTISLVDFVTPFKKYFD